MKNELSNDAREAQNLSKVEYPQSPLLSFSGTRIIDAINELRKSGQNWKYYRVGNDSGYYTQI